MAISLHEWLWSVLLAHRAILNTCFLFIFRVLQDLDSESESLFISFLLRSIFYPRHSMHPLGKAKGPESPQDLPCTFTQGLHLLIPFVGILFSSQDGSIPCTECSGQWNFVLRGLDCFPCAPVGGTKSRIGLSPNPLLWLTVESWCYVCKVQIREV